MTAYPALLDTANRMHFSGTGRVTVTIEQLTEWAARSPESCAAAEAYLAPLSPEQRDYVACPWEEGDAPLPEGMTWDGAYKCAASPILSAIFNGGVDGPLP